MLSQNVSIFAIKVNQWVTKITWMAKIYMFSVLFYPIVIAKGHSGAGRQYAKQGCHAGLRKDLWRTIFGLSLDELVI